MYTDEDMLMLSGIQHYRFCPRQWALIHLEQKWDENRLTIEGQIQHRHVDDPSYRQKCGDRIVLRSVHLVSYQLGLYGISDAIELVPTEDSVNSIHHPSYPGLWKPIPIEYKHGHPKQNEIDEVQLVAQVICLEEMYSIHLEYGDFFYWETRHRQEVEITPKLRRIVEDCAREMHSVFKSGIIPGFSVGKHCVSCSLKNVCLPELKKCTTVRNYLEKYLKNEEIAEYPVRDDA